MVTKKQLFLSFLFSVFVLSVYGQDNQDVIYRFDGEPLACVVSDITDNEIRYTDSNTDRQKELSLEKDRALLVFRDNGDFFLPYGKQDTWVRGADTKVHKIITKDYMIYPAQFLEIEGNKLSYLDYMNQANRVLDTDDVLLIIHKNGKHQLFAPTTEVVEALNTLGPNLNNYASENGAASMAKGVGADNVPELNIVELSADEEAYFINVAETKASDFGKYLTLICGTNNETVDKLYAIDAACALFVNDSAKIEVSSAKSKTKQQFPVRDYLDRLRILPYDKVEITWLQASMVCGLRPGTDGNYYGVIAAQQLFKGYLDNKVVYQDVTDKDIEVVLTRYEVFDEGESKQKWDVFLSNIGVQQTRNK